jgi:hypothetical protein
MYLPSEIEQFKMPPFSSYRICRIMELEFCEGEWGNMKKFVLGMLIGIGLSLGVTAYAADIVSLIGKKVDGSFPLIINNVRADKDVLVIDGTSYLPVRSAAALFGYDVSFNADLMVLLTKKSEATIKNDTEKESVATPAPSTIPVPTPSQVPTASVEPVESKADIIDKIKINIIGMNSQINVVLDEIKKKEALLKSIQNDNNQAAKMQSTKEEIKRLKSVLADYTKQLEKLNKALKEQSIR